MKKILIAFDGKHFSEAVLQFTRKLNERNPVLVTGAFLPQVNYANLWSYSGGGLSGADFIPLVEDSDATQVKNNIKRFESYCHTNKIAFSVHKDYFDFAIPELKKESRYADLLIISSEAFYKQAGTGLPNEYLIETMRDMECPVIIVPEKFEFPENNILLYDGSESSVYAIKQFANLFPELANNPSILVHATVENDLQSPDKINKEEIITHHFPHTVFETGITTKKHFITWLTKKKAAMVISGAFGRSGLSMLFRKSFITEVISEHRLPVFIAHR